MNRVKSDILSVERATKQRNNLLRRDFNTLNHLILTGGQGHSVPGPYKSITPKKDWKSYALDAAKQGAKWTGNKALEGAKWTGNKALEGAKWTGNKALNLGKRGVRQTNDIAIKRACTICGSHSVTDGDVDDILEVLRSIYKTVLKELKKVKQIKQKREKR